MTEKDTWSTLRTNVNDCCAGATLRTVDLGFCACM
jgi:hypothetical protein